MIQTQQPIPHQHLRGLKAEGPRSWDVIPPLRNVSVGASFNTVNEEQKKQIQFFTDQLSDFNCVQYRTLPVNSSRGKNVIGTAKKVSMTTVDIGLVHHIAVSVVNCTAK